ncbi:IPT/TIG domain-containing protein [Kitasatospora phosalacinea]|uniref:IPT/TIG domain-containing protein n=1 Tax=Kitasatospora phosalacinea TaxID=2065 RepID=UPI00365A49F6
MLTAAGLVTAASPAEAAGACDITAITPATGPANATTSVTVTGHGFTDLAACGDTVGYIEVHDSADIDEVVTDIDVTDSAVTFDVPALPAGTYTVLLRGAPPYGAIKWGSTTFTAVPPQADLAVGLSAVPGPLLSMTIGYSQTVHNNGPDTAASGTVTTTLPSQTASVSGLPGNCAYDSTAKTVACTLSGLAGSTTQTNGFTATISTLALGPLPASATRTTSSPTDPVSGNDSATATCSALTGLIVTC